MRPLLEFCNVNCEIHASTRLRNVSFLLFEGEFVSLVGVDNSGSSLIVDLLSGRRTASEGEVLMSNKTYKPHGIHEANRKGVYCISQRNCLIDDQSIAENFFVNTGKAPLFSFVRERANLFNTSRILEQYGLDFHPKDRVGKFSENVKCVLSMIKYKQLGARLIVLSNVMKSGTAAENELFLRVVKQILNQQTSVFLLMNQCSEILRNTNRILLLSQMGRIAKTVYPEEYNAQQIEAYLVNSHAETLPTRSAATLGKILLRVENPIRNDVKAPIVLREGEVLGILNRSRWEYDRSVDLKNGLNLIRGKIWLDGKEVWIQNEADAARNGIGLIPDDLKKLYYSDLSIESNVISTFINHAGNRLGILGAGRLRALRQDVEYWFHQIQSVFEFNEGDDCIYSIVIRFLMFPYKVVILTQPGRINDKRKVDMLYWMMDILLKQGKAFIVISGSEEELKAVATTVY